MYNPKGVDKGHEWIELTNLSQQKIDLSRWKIEINNRKHQLNPPPKNGGQGSIIIQPNQYFIITDNAKTFLSDHQNYQGTVIDSSFSLTNKSGEIKILDQSEKIIDQIQYSSSWGGNGNGKTLEKINLNQGNDQQNWTESQKSGGSPDQKNPNTLSTDKKPSPLESSKHSTSSSTILKNNSLNQSTPNKTSQPLLIVSTPTPATPSPIQAKTKENLIYALINQEINFDGSNSIFPTGTKILWNFGDGITNNKIETSHSYSFPGTYLITLNLSFDNQSSQAKMKIIVYPRNIFINEFYPNPKGKDKDKEWIEIANQNNFPIDISNYKIYSGNKNKFNFPIGSLIAPQSYLVIRPTISLKNSSSSLSLLYPNKSLLQRIIYPSAKENWSIARDSQGQFYFTAQPTPGTENLFTTTTTLSKITPLTSSAKKFIPKTKNNIQPIENHTQNKKDLLKPPPSQKLSTKKKLKNNDSNLFPLPKLNKTEPLILNASINQPSDKNPNRLISFLFSMSLIISGIIWIIKKPT